MNGTNAKIDVWLTPSDSRDVLRRDLIALRNKHRADTMIGHRCSNLVELIQMPELPRFQLERQMADLHRLLNDAQ